MIAFENDIFPRQIAAQPGPAKPPAAPPMAAKGAAMASARGAGGPPAGGFQIIFEAEARDLPPRPGGGAAPSGRPAATENTGFQRVFEAEFLPPLPPARTQTASTSATGTVGGKPGNVPLWDNGGFGFSDILDVVNPLQHLPIISTIYRAETGDKIGAIPRILGSMLFGGGLIGAVVGAATAVVNLAVEQETGKDIGGHIYTALFGEGGKNARSTTIATIATRTNVTNPAPAAASAAPQNLLATPRPASATAAITPAPVKAKPAPASPPAPITPAPKPAPAPAAKPGPPSGGVRVTGKAAPPASLETAARKAVSNQFRRAAWYRKNQDALAAQAAELARAGAAAQSRAAKSTGGPQAKTATGEPDMLRLFTAKAAAAKSKSSISRPAPIAKARMAAEMSKAMIKYEQLLKSRIAADTQINRVR